MNVKRKITRLQSQKAPTVINSVPVARKTIVKKGGCGCCLGKKKLRENNQ